MRLEKTWGRLDMKYRLSDLCEYRKEKVPVSDVKIENYISTENMLPNKEGITIAASIPNTGKVSRYKKGDILVSNIRPYFQKIWLADREGACSNDILIINANCNISNEYLYYSLTSNEFFLYMMSTSKGTKMPRGDKEAIMQFELDILSREKQEKAITLLSLLDKKIHANRMINNNLEQQAMAIFKNWLIDYEPFVNHISTRWEPGTIKDLSKEIICGKTPSTKKAEYYGSDVPFITIPDMHNKVFSIKTARYLSVEGASSQIKKMLPNNTICVSCIGTAGLVTITSENSQTNQQINSIIPKDKISPYYIYLLMKTLSNKINKLGQSGSTIVNLNKEQFSKIKINIPDDISMNRFHKIISPLFNSILNNQKENLYLSDLKNTILPRLLSGELDISNIEI